MRAKSTDQQPCTPLGYPSYLGQRALAPALFPIEAITIVLFGTFRPSVTVSRLAVALTLSLALGVAAACDRPVQMHGVMRDPPKPVPAFDFTLPSGAPLHTAAEAGRPMLVFFGYTNCPDVCPTTLADWKRVKTKLGTRGERVRFLFVTVDPERDTPAVADAYARKFDPSFIGVSGDAALTARIMAAFDVSAAKEAVTDSTHYFMAHAAQAFLVDDKSRIIAMYPLGIGWEALAADLENIL